MPFSPPSLLFDAFRRRTRIKQPLSCRGDEVSSPLPECVLAILDGDLAIDPLILPIRFWSESKLRPKKTP